MRYLRVEWLHSNADEPVMLYSEVDDEGWETRKLEVFPDGSKGFASMTEATPATVLGEKPVPPVEAITADPQFRPALITREEFEQVWASRKDMVHTATGD